MLLDKFNSMSEELSPLRIEIKRQKRCPATLQNELRKLSQRRKNIPYEIFHS